MKISSECLFCDWLTVSQTHMTKHTPHLDGYSTITDQAGEITRRSPLWKSLEGEHGSSIQIRSDGETVFVEGNPSRFNRSENYHGLNLDQVKDLINQMLESVDLPPFTGGELKQLSDGSQSYSGAIFSRIDMTGNIKTGSPGNRETYLKYQQTQEFPKLEKHLVGKNTYYGKESESRTILIYDKAHQLSEKVLKYTDEKEYIRELIAYCEANGILRFETRYRRYLRTSNLRQWHRATHKNLTNKTIKDIDTMTPEIEAPDYGGIPNKALGTLLMYMAGLDVRQRLSHQTYYKHRKILKAFGYDISSRNIHLLQAKVKIITLEPAGVPEFYKHAKALEG